MVDFNEPFKKLFNKGMITGKNGIKMSKSKGEFLTVSLLEQKGYKPVVYRFFCLQSHYRRPLVFSWENLDNAATTYNKLLTRIAPLTAASAQGSPDTESEEYLKLRSAFMTALDSDLNTAQAITVVYDVLKSGLDSVSKLSLIADFDAVLGLDLIQNAKSAAESDSSGELPAEVASLLEQRTAARKAKDFALADELRDKISALGYEVRETRQGTQVFKR